MGSELDDALLDWAFRDNPQARLAADAAGRIRAWSRGASDFLGHGPQVVGAPAEDLFASPGDLRAALDAAASSGFLRNARFEMRCRDGGRRAALVSLSVLRSKAGWVAELSEPAAAPEGAMRDALLRAERFGALGRMTAAFTHEMRTPLHVVASTAEFALDCLGPEGKLRESLEMILRNARQAALSVRSMLDYARVGRPRKVEATLAEAVEAAVRPLEKTCAARGISLRWSLGAAPPSLIDPAQVRAAVQNLFVNALEATPEGGSIEIETRALPDGGASVSVRDSGRGMSPAVLERAGSPFFTTKEEGAGLGLYLTKRILEEHGAVLSFGSGRSGTLATASFPPPPGR